MNSAFSEDIQKLRPELFAVAYNMLGSMTDAEDVVQDSLIAWMKSDRSDVKDPKHYLIRTITHRCINLLKQLQRKRLNYIGTWLPEPAVQPDEESKCSRSEQDKQLSIGFLYLLENLNATERAVLILRESFDYPYSVLGDILGLTEDNCRKILSRAKAKLKNARKPTKIDRHKHRQMLQLFLQACIQEDRNSLESMLVQDVSFYSDGGGKASAAVKPLHGREAVLKFILGIIKKTGSIRSTKTLLVNGLPGAAIYTSVSEAPDLVFTFDLNDLSEQIETFYFIRNPDKLRHVRLAN